MDFIRKEKEEKNEKPIPSYRSRLSSDRKMLFGFSEYLKSLGASYYTMRDRIIYGTTPFAEWELKGVLGMIREFDPDYDGKPEDFFGRLSRERRSLFSRFMVSRGGMSRSTCYFRFRLFNFCKWELLGIRDCEDGYLEVLKKEELK